MKKFKSIIIFIITASIILSLPMISKAESPADSDYEKNVRMLYDLRLIADKESFSDAEKNVTRIELLKTVVAYMGLSGLVAETHKEQFADVDVYSDYNNYIAIGVDRGILTGFSDGCFYPDAEAETIQAVKIITALFGYKSVAERDGGYPAGYINTASKIGLLKGVGNAELLNNRAFVRLLVNGLDADIMTYNDTEMKSGESFLEETYKIYEHKGIMTATDENAALGENELHGSYVKIGGKELYSSDEDIKEHFGEEIRLYYKNGDFGDEIKYYEATDKNKKITVKSDDIEASHSSFSESTFVYSENDKVRSANISGAAVVYNGRTDAFYSRANLAPKNGEVTLLDNNGDGKYEYVFVFDPQYEILLRGVQSDGDKLKYYDYLDSNVSFTVDTDTGNKYSVTKDGKRIPLSDLTEYDVILAGQSKNGDYTVLKASTKTASGKLTATEGKDEVVIGGEKYKVSGVYSDYSSKKTSKYINELKPGLEGTYYIDIYGKIAAATKNDDDSLKYGYLFKASPNEDDDESAWIKMLTQDNENKNFTLTDKVSFNGERIKAKLAVQKLNLGGPDTDYGKGSGCRQVIMYRTDEAGNVKEIHTTADSEILSYEGTHTKVDIFDYYLLSWNKERFANDKTVWFSIYPSDEEMSEAVSWDNNYPSGQTVYFYNKDTELNVGAVIRYREGMAALGNSSINTTQRFAIVDDIISVADEDDMERKAVKCYGVNGTEYVIYPSDKTNSYVQERLYELKPGDVFIYDTDEKGRLSAVVRIYDSSKPDVYGAWGDNSQLETTHKSPQGILNKWFWYDKSRWEIYGKVYDLIGDCVLYYIQEDGAGKPILTKDYLKDVPMAVIDTTKGKTEFTFNYEYSQIAAGDNILVGGESKRVNEVVIIRN